MNYVILDYNHKFRIEGPMDRYDISTGIDGCLEVVKADEGTWVKYSEALPLLKKLHCWDALHYLLWADVVFMGEKGPYVLVNDTFAYACADGEEFTLSEAPMLKFIHQEWPEWGLTAWAALKRKSKLMPELENSEKYQAVKKEVEKYMELHVALSYEPKV